MPKNTFPQNVVKKQSKYEAEKPNKEMSLNHVH